MNTSEQEDIDAFMASALDAGEEFFALIETGPWPERTAESADERLSWCRFGNHNIGWKYGWAMIERA